MTEILTVAQMRAIEAAAISSGEVTGLELMERAGGGVVAAIFEKWPELGGRGASPSRSPEYFEQDERVGGGRAVVLCGPGNNGGDGFVVARLLAQRGWAVEVFLYGDAARLPVDARVNYQRWRACGGSVTGLSLIAFRLGGKDADIYVDALFGAGFSRALEGEAYKVLHHMSGINGDDYWRRTVAVDGPSGLCLDSGRMLRAPLTPEIQQQLERIGNGNENGAAAPLWGRSAALTVTFDSPKVGHYCGNGPAFCGQVVVKDIGVEEWRCFQSPAQGRPAIVRRKQGITGVLRFPRLKLLTKDPLVPDPRRETMLTLPFFAVNKGETVGHKFTHGHAVVVSGGPGKTGAARLAARGALRIGAGVVSLAVPPSAQQDVAGHVTAVMIHRVKAAVDLEALLNDSRINALCVGPALGLDVRAAAMVAATLAAKRSTVLDADALTLLSRDSALFDALHCNCVLTPHHGEFRRLFPDIAAKLAAPADSGPAFSKVDATRDAAARAGCVVLYKGADTVIAAPDGRCSLNSACYERAAPWLATAGSGDVLAGLITGLMARGIDAMVAAEMGAWLHVESARSFGPGLIAEDLPEELPKVFKRLFSQL